ncbi:MAG: pyridoxal phosphate-dependent aminotransferase [Micromonosporaceae bacterium]
MEVIQAARLAGIRYDIRGPVHQEAMRIEASGERVLKLNIGNPARFGFEAPEPLVQEITRNLSTAHGYGESKGLREAREAIARYYHGRRIAGVEVDDIYVGNGASELIMMSLQGLLDDGDEVLVPAPDYPLWTAAVGLAGGRAVHYLCDESADWAPDLDDIAAKVTPRTKGLVVINPNNPTGAVYGEPMLRGLVELARRHNLVLFSDEIYDKILYDGVSHTSTAALAPDLLCLTFNGLSKAYRLCGYRTGWLVVSGTKEHAASYIEGLDRLASMRLCPNMPSQYAVAPALEGYQSINDLVLPGGRLHEQRDIAWKMLNDIPGISCVKPTGALYAFPRIDPQVHPIADDERFVLDLLRAEKLLIVHGTGFNWPKPDHFRVVTLPPVDDLAEAIGRIGRFLSTYRQ